MAKKLQDLFVACDVLDLYGSGCALQGVDVQQVEG